MKVPVICSEEKIQVGHLAVDERSLLSGQFILGNYFPESEAYALDTRPADGQMLKCPRCQFWLCIKGVLRTKGAPPTDGDVLVPIIVGKTSVELGAAE